MKKLLTGIGLTLLLTACGGDKTPNAGFTTLTGILVENAADASDTTLTTKAWTGGAGTVKLVNIGASDNDMALSSGTLQSNGAFSVELKNPTSGLVTLSGSIIDDISSLFTSNFLNQGNVDLRQLLSCTGQPTLSATGVQMTAASLDIDAGKDGSALPLTATKSADDHDPTGSVYFGMLIYVDRPVEVTGGQDCQANTDRGGLRYTTAYNLKLGQGWNKVTFGSDLVAKQDQGKQPVVITVSATSGNFPTNNWVFLGDGAMIGQSLSLKSLKLPALR